MLRWIRKRGGRQTPPQLAGAPPVRRQKTYSGQSGYVYQYYYEGYRAAEREGEAGYEYVFDVSADRKASFPVSVFVSDAVTRAWERHHARALNSTERYAVAKMALFQAFDERNRPAQLREDVCVRGADVEDILATLGID